MSSPQPFVVPEGVVFQIDEDGVVIENRGDIVLHTSFGRTLKRIVSSEGSVHIHAPAHAGLLQAAGSISVHGDVEAAELRAGGDVTIAGSLAGGDVDAGGGVSVEGTVVAGTIRGDAVQLPGASIQARGIQGRTSVELGGGKAQVDAVIAPTVTIPPRTIGRVTIVESQNDIGALAIKGAFRLTDYAEMFGDPGPYLAERGLSALGDAPRPAPPSAPPPRVEPPQAPPLAGPRVEPVAPDAPAAIVVPPPTMREVIELPKASPPVEEPEVVDVQETPLPPAHPMHGQLMDAVAKIVEAYAGTELPPAVERLRGMADTREYERIRGEITNIWSELLKFHQKKGLRIQHQVTTTFNAVNALVKKM
jgi:hypothetical protein